jgi:hypothetical protein
MSLFSQPLRPPPEERINLTQFLYKACVAIPAEAGIQNPSLYLPFEIVSQSRLRNRLKDEMLRSRSPRHPERFQGVGVDNAASFY